MAIYVTSDIHGYLKEFRGLLEDVSPADEDTIIIAGDIIDRGPAGTNALKWLFHSAPDNIEFILGNHEEMLLSFLVCSEIVDTPAEDETRDMYRYRHSNHVYNHPWAYNGARFGEVFDIFDQYDSEEWMSIRTWLETVPLAKFISGVNGHEYAIVHAGFNPKQYEPLAYWGRQDRLLEDGHRTDEIDHPLLGHQIASDMLWSREGWYNRTEPDPVQIVSGHTPLTAQVILDIELSVDSRNRTPTPKSTDPYCISHIQTRHLIDCGSGHRRRNGSGRCAMLRLDDLAAFYEGSKTPKFPSDAYLDWYNNCDI